MKAIIKSIVKHSAMGVYKVMYYILPLNKKYIIFESSVGRNYSGNPKYIYEEIVNQGLDQQYKCIWIREKSNFSIPGKCRQVKRLSISYFYYMATAKFWIADSRQPRYLKKKKENIYIQTWHGTPLKKIGVDMNFVNMSGDRNIKEYQRIFKENSSRWDYLISQNNYSTEIFRSAFAFDKDILEIGYPRNDILINNNNSIYIKSIKNKLGIPIDKKVILYAPTWRDNQYHTNGQYKFSMGLNLQKVLDAIGKEYVLLLKPHYLVVDKIDIKGYEKQIFIFDIQQDIQELYLISDILITDYSSVMFDYSLLKRPIIFFTYDLKHYKEEIRGFYFDILETPPGKVVLNNEQLIEAVKNINLDYVKYQNNYQKFSEIYNSKDDGKASKKIVELIKILS